jgi:hypothetical protein
MNTHIILAVLALLLVAGCTQGTTGDAMEETDGDAMEDTHDGDAMEKDGDAMEKKPSVTVSNQTVQDEQVTIATVYADQAGWIVIHADDGGAPSTVLGITAVSAGNNTNVKVGLGTDTVTEQLHAMLHIDAGLSGEYEFPGEDAPVTVDGKVVNVPFSTVEDVSLETAIKNMTEFMEENGGDAGVATTPLAEDQDFSGTMSRSGDFVNVNYMTSGSATLESKEGENFVVFSEDFSTPNGPDLVVYLGKNTAPTTRGDISAGIELAELKSTNGKQVYTIPQGVDITEYNSVNIHCRAFNVPWSYAPFS